MEDVYVENSSSDGICGNIPGGGIGNVGTECCVGTIGNVGPIGNVGTIYCVDCIDCEKSGKLLKKGEIWIDSVGVIGILDSN